MTNSNIVLLAEKNGEYGIYNMLSSFFQGIKSGFEQQPNTEIYWISDAQKEPDITISFNVAGIESWKDILQSNIHHFMWTVDSCFYQNFGLLKDYNQFPNFHILGVAKNDIEPLNYFYPNFKNYHYLPHGVDSNIWKYENQEKDLDIVYLASIHDPEQIIENVRQKLPPNLFEIFMGMFDYLKTNPYVNIWDLHKNTFIEGESLNNEQKAQHAITFHYFFSNLSYLLSYTKRIQLVKSMEDVGIKIWGNNEWQKYVSGKNQYMGSADFKQVLQIIPRSKISLNLQPLQIIDGLHERILNSALSESAILCDAAPEIKKTFGESLTYYDVKNFTNIKQKALSLLANKDIREYKVQKAKEIVLKDHTWNSRVESIQGIINNFQKQQHAPLV